MIRLIKDIIICYRSKDISLDVKKQGNVYSWDIYKDNNFMIYTRSNDRIYCKNKKLHKFLTYLNLI